LFPSGKRFVFIVFIGLLATGANLVEPLIYREAINDVAGLFIQKAKDETRQKYQSPTDTAQVEEEDDSGLEAIVSKILPREPHSKRLK